MLRQFAAEAVAVAVAVTRKRVFFTRALEFQVRSAFPRPERCGDLFFFGQNFDHGWRPKFRGFRRLGFFLHLADAKRFHLLDSSLVGDVVLHLGKGRDSSKPFN